MASIKTMLRGYVIDDREKNWTKEYAAREISRHKSTKVLDHPDGSVTTAKLCDKSITREKLGDGVLEMFDEVSRDTSALSNDLSREAAIRKEADEKKADKATTLSGYGITNAYTKNEVDSKLNIKADKDEIPTKVSELKNDKGYLTQHQDISGKADKATTLSGYGITNAYTKAEVDTALDEKADVLEFTTDSGKTHKIEDSRDYPFKSLSLHGASEAAENPTVRAYGKNLIKPVFANYPQNIIADGNEVNINNTSSEAIYPQINLSPQLPSGEYTLSLNVTSISGQPLIYVQYPDHGYKTVLRISSTGFKTLTFTKPVQSIMFTLQAGSFMTLSNLQLEVGAAATEFEPYKEPQSVAVPYTYADGDSLTLENGTVKNNISGIEEDITNTKTGQALLALHANYPSTAVICDADCKVVYKADTTNAFKKLNGELDTLKQAIINLGGTI